VFLPKGSLRGLPQRKGKKKISEGDHKSQNQKRASREWSPRDIKFKKARYDQPDHSDDSNEGNDMGFKDFPMFDFQKETLCPRDIPLSESIDTSALTATSILKEKLDTLATTIIPTQVTPDDVVEAMPLQSVLTTIASLFVNSIED